MQAMSGRRSRQLPEEHLLRLPARATADSTEMTDSLNYVHWRQGFEDKCHIYACTGEDPEDDPFVGRMTAPAIAAEVVQAHNERLI